MLNPKKTKKEFTKKKKRKKQVGPDEIYKNELECHQKNIIEK